MNIIVKPGAQLQINNGHKHHQCDCEPEPNPGEGSNCECPEDGRSLPDIFPLGQEALTGRYDLSDSDGIKRPTFIQTVKLGTLPNTASTKEFNLRSLIPDFRRVIVHGGIFQIFTIRHGANPARMFNLTHSTATSLTHTVNSYIDGEAIIYIAVGSDRSDLTAYATLEYTKNE